MTATILPHVTAGLNGLTTVLLLIAFGFIRAGRRDAHRATMLCAVVVSAIFLACYLVYHFTAPIFVFAGDGALLRGLYYVLLVSHVVLALAIVPMIVFTLRRALAGQTVPHQKLARWTFPVWLYVSLSGLAVYAMLYHLYPPATAA